MSIKVSPSPWTLLVHSSAIKVRHVCSPTSQGHALACSAKHEKLKTHFMITASLMTAMLQVCHKQGR